MTILAIPAIGDPQSPIIAGEGPREVTLLDIAVPYEVYRGTEVMIRYRRKQVAERIARDLGSGFRVRKLR